MAAAKNHEEEEDGRLVGSLAPERRGRGKEEEEGRDEHETKTTFTWRSAARI
jgi:hypothetical protein